MQLRPTKERQNKTNAAWGHFAHFVIKTSGGFFFSPHGTPFLRSCTHASLGYLINNASCHKPSVLNSECVAVQIFPTGLLTDTYTNRNATPLHQIPHHS